MRLVSILFGVTVAVGIAVFVLSAHRPSIHTPVSQPMVSQPPVSQPKAAPFVGELGDSPNFAVAAERAMSELHDGTTVTEWMAHHPGAGKIDGASIGIGGECVILAETATLRDGAQVARLVSFNPPRAPSPAVLPILQGESLINDTCTMSMVQIEVKVSDEAAGRSVQRAVNRQLNSTYGPSADQVGVWHSGPIEIVNAYDSGHRLAFDTGKPKFGPAAYEEYLCWEPRLQHVGGRTAYAFCDLWAGRSRQYHDRPGYRPLPRLRFRGNGERGRKSHCRDQRHPGGRTHVERQRSAPESRARRRRRWRTRSRRTWRRRQGSILSVRKVSVRCQTCGIALPWACFLSIRLMRSTSRCTLTTRRAPVAQLDRAIASGAIGREFESLRAHQI